ncbi:MAG: nucleotide exchange factor GrpE [Anaeromyxobacter sp.]
MSDTHERGAFQADIPADAVEEALRSVEKSKEAAAEPEVVVDAGAPEAAEGLAELVQRLRSLEAQLEFSQTKSRETLDKLREEHERHLRAVADLENFKKRAQREREETLKFGNEKLLKDLFPVMDGLDRALAAAAADDPLRQGVQLVRTSFEQALGRHGVKAFSAMGQPFDPALHEALMQVPTAEQPPGTVVMEHARGFLLNERLARPAMVGVSVAPPPGDAGDAGSGGNG